MKAFASRYGLIFADKDSMESIDEHILAVNNIAIAAAVIAEMRGLKVNDGDALAEIERISDRLLYFYEHTYHHTFYHTKDLIRKIIDQKE